MAVLGREGFAIGAERGEYGVGGLAADAAEERGLVAEAGQRVAGGFGEFLEEVEGARAFRLAEGGMDGGDALFAVDLVAGGVEDGLAGEAVDGAAVAEDECLGGGSAGGATVAGFAASEDEGGGEALDVPIRRGLGWFRRNR